MKSAGLKRYQRCNIKKREDYTESKPKQLCLFEIIKPDQQQYSNTIEFYDAIPKYVWRMAKTDQEQVKPVKREFEHKKEMYRVSISPAWIEAPDGTDKVVFPGQREELVEDVLRKFACEGRGMFLDDKASVAFTLYEVEQELKKQGHSYNKNQIKEAIMICAQTNIKVETKKGKAIFISSLFETIGLKTLEDWKGHGGKTKAFVRFNSLVTKSIKNQTFRLINYNTAMSYGNILARWFHKRMAHNYSGASMRFPFGIMLTTILRDSGMQKRKKLTDNIRQVEKALREMEEKEVLLGYKVEQTIENRRLVNAKFMLIPHPQFITEIKLANKHQNEVMRLSKNLPEKK